MIKDHQEKSQSHSSKSGMLIFASIFALFWDAVVLGLLIPNSNAPFTFKMIFGAIGVAVTALAVSTWRQHLMGGAVKMHLSADPVPHGINVSAKFELAKKVSAKTWTVEAKLEQKPKDRDNFFVLWSQTFPVRIVDAQRMQANFVFPSDYSPENLKGSSATYQRTLLLKADKISWDFLLQVRDATSAENAFGLQDAVRIGDNRPAFPVADIKQQNIGKKAAIFAALFFTMTIAEMALNFFDVDLWQRVKTKVMATAYNTQVTTDEFDVRVTNGSMYDWSLTGRLVGKGRVTNGELRVRLEGLDVQSTQRCKGEAKECEIAQATLLLADDKGSSFSTVGRSNPIQIDAQLQEVTRWSLPADQIGTELVMQLPPSVDADTMRLKLEIRTTADTTVYPDGGPYLALHRALAKANGQQDPCEQLTTRLSLVQADCRHQLLTLHTSPVNVVTTLIVQAKNLWLTTRHYASTLGLGSVPAEQPETLDSLLIQSLRLETFTATDALLQMGASPNAEDADQPGRTALGYAAVTKDMTVVDRLLQAGALPNARKPNETGQIVTPLTQALRSDAANTIERLIQAGASIHTDDPTGWTPMHIAAFDSSKRSIEILVKAGANVNERTPAYREQNVLQTALQFGDFETANVLIQLGADLRFKDNQGKNACDWAQFFKRNERIQALVCQPA